MFVGDKDSSDVRFVGLDSVELDMMYVKICIR